MTYMCKHILVSDMQTQNVLKNKRTISLEGATLDRLKEIGTMGDTYDTVINRLIDEHLERKHKK